MGNVDELGTMFEKMSLAQRTFNSFVPVQSGTNLYAAQRTYLEGSLSVGTIAIGAVTVSGGTVSTTTAMASSATYGSVSVGTTATLIVGSNANRKGLLITNDTGTTMFIGTANDIGTSGAKCGFKAYSRETFSPTITKDIYGVIDTGTGSAYYWQEV